VPVEMVQFLLNIIETDNSYCVPRFPLIASCHKIFDSHLHSRYMKEPGLGVGQFTSDSTTLASDMKMDLRLHLEKVDQVFQARKHARLVHQFCRLKIKKSLNFINTKTSV